MLNNPLSFVDPSGEFWHLVIGAALGAIVGGVSQAMNGGNFGDILFGVVSGAIIGAASAGVGNIAAGGTFFGATTSATGFSAGFAAGAAAGATGGFLTLEITKLYHSGRVKDIRLKHFYGRRIELNGGFDVGLSLGVNASYATVKNANFKVYGYGSSVGVGWSATLGSLNINWGASGKNLKHVAKFTQKN